LDRLSKQSAGDALPEAPIIVDGGTTASAKVPDLESLWKELTEGPLHPVPNAAPPEVAKPAVSFDLKERQPAAQAPTATPAPVITRGSEESSPDLDEIASELERVKTTERERVGRYAKITAKVDMANTPQGFSKVKSRKVQKDLVKAWNPDEIAKQDHLRQEFTKALFKKK
jgi:hypothetical protein